MTKFYIFGNSLKYLILNLGFKKSNYQRIMESLKDLISILSASLAPIVAIFGILYTKKNFDLSRRKRKDELFDRRYKFLKDFEKLWKSTGSESKGATRMSLEWDEIEPFAQEAYFLFGKDIADHIRSYQGKSFDQNLPWVPDSELAKPFHKYLCFEN
ncbi:hypothetical protein [Sphingobacterium sp. DR205]|uniref:hypothetical protein n=1 Tax=Sphingobacterium sp. DR205 TaxID=2713573 RepID=UPI0013E4E50D|nr:hypothetical protein [Sphingobacterium sp. DR205]QIH33453.1 hypothetical protein G6053_11405 [Sphingobacterium sp. DR205]